MNMSKVLAGYAASTRRRLVLQLYMTAFGHSKLQVARFAQAAEILPHPSNDHDSRAYPASPEVAERRRFP
jgi:hypothetical protein